MGHEYCGAVEEVGQEVTKIKPGQFVVGSFATSDNTCAICKHGYQSSCVQREFMSTAQASVLRVPLAEGTLVATNDLPPKELIPSLLTTTLYCKGQQFKENSVSLSVLTKSAERFSLDSLKQDFANKERKLLQDLFFAWDRVDLSDTDILRRHTLGLVLNSVQEYQKADSRPTLKEVDHYLVYPFGLVTRLCLQL